jgi:hypothetical protein
MSGKMTALDKWMTKGFSKAQKAQWMSKTPKERKRLVEVTKKTMASERKRVNKQIAEDRRKAAAKKKKTTKRRKAAPKRKTPTRKRKTPTRKRKTPTRKRKTPTRKRPTLQQRIAKNTKAIKKLQGGRKK